MSPIDQNGWNAACRPWFSADFGDHSVPILSVRRYNRDCSRAEPVCEAGSLPLIMLKDADLRTDLPT